MALTGWYGCLNTSSPDSPTLPAGLRSALEALLPAEGLLTSTDDCWAYGYDNSRQQALSTVEEEITKLSNYLDNCLEEGEPA